MTIEYVGWKKGIALRAIDRLTPAADQLPYFTAANAAALATLTSFARTLLDDTDAATARTTLGLGSSDSPTFSGVTAANIGLGGAAPSATSLINMSSSPANTNGFTSINNVLIPVASETGTYTNYCEYNIIYPQVSATKTNSGAMYANYMAALRSATVDSDDSGTLNTLMSSRIIAGHSANSAASSPTTTSVFGFRLTPYILRGTITTYYGAYLDAPTTLSVPSDWATGAKAKYAICKPTVANGYYYVCTTAGASGASEPSPWNTTVGGKTTDGSAEWTTISIPSIGTEWGMYVASTTAKNYLASNLGVGQLTFGTSGTKILALSTGAAPSTSPADSCQIYSADQTAGNACFHTRTENGKIIKLYQQAHIADIDATVIATITAASGTADGTIADVGASFDQTTLNNNFKECATNLNNLKTVVDDMRTKMNTMFSYKENTGFHATS